MKNEINKLIFYLDALLTNLLCTSQPGVDFIKVGCTALISDFRSPK